MVKYKLTVDFLHDKKHVRSYARSRRNRVQDEIGRENNLASRKQTSTDSKVLQTINKVKVKNAECTYF